MKVWHKRKELPNTKEKTIVYVFDDGIDVEDYCLSFFTQVTLKNGHIGKMCKKLLNFIRS